MYGHSGLFYYLPKLKPVTRRNSITYAALVILDSIATWCNLTGQDPLVYTYTLFSFLTNSGICELDIPNKYTFLETTNEPFNFGTISGSCNYDLVNNTYLYNGSTEAFNFGVITGNCQSNLQTIDYTGGTYTQPTYPTALTGLFQEAIPTGNNCSLVGQTPIEYVYSAFSFTAVSGFCELIVNNTYLFLSITDEPFNFGTISGECQYDLVNNTFLYSGTNEPFNFGFISGSCGALLS